MFLLRVFHRETALGKQENTVNTDPNEGGKITFVKKLKAKGEKKGYPCDLYSKHPAQSNHFKVPVYSKIKII